MTAALIQSPDRVILKHISWQTYQSLILDTMDNYWPSTV
jgi:hypothetical protein